MLGLCSRSWEDPSAPSGLSPELPVRSTTTTVTLSLRAWTLSACVLATQELPAVWQLGQWSE